MLGRGVGKLQQLEESRHDSLLDETRLLPVAADDRVLDADEGRGDATPLARVQLVHVRARTLALLEQNTLSMNEQRMSSE